MDEKWMKMDMLVQRLPKACSSLHCLTGSDEAPVGNRPFQHGATALRKQSRTPCQKWGPSRIPSPWLQLGLTSYGVFPLENLMVGPKTSLNTRAGGHRPQLLLAPFENRIAKDRRSNKPSAIVTSLDFLYQTISKVWLVDSC